MQVKKDAQMVTAAWLIGANMRGPALTSVTDGKLRVVKAAIAVAEMLNNIPHATRHCRFLMWSVITNLQGLVLGTLPVRAARLGLPTSSNQNFNALSAMS